MSPSDATWRCKYWEYYLDARTDSEVDSDDEYEVSDNDLNEPGSSYDNPIDLTSDDSDEEEED